MSDLVMKMITLGKSVVTSTLIVWNRRSQSTAINHRLIIGVHHNHHQQQQQRMCTSQSGGGAGGGEGDNSSSTSKRTSLSSTSSSLSKRTSLSSSSSSSLSKRTSPSSSELKSSMVKKIPDNEIRKSVFISQSNDIFTNLALEDWLYRHFDFSYHHVLLLWANNPAVVIGRHQIPFLETNVSRLQEHGIVLARRNSGGGTVYHDGGNLNCSFFVPRERYDRRYNLNILTRALFREWTIKAEINERDDILLNDKKISGTAAKLGYPNSYHHCTLLVNTDKQQLTECLKREDVNYVSKATASVPMGTRNLQDVNRSVNVTKLLSAIGYEYLRTSATVLEDGGSCLAMKQRGFQLVNPSEKWFPGIDALRDEFVSWNWIFGKTPTFMVEKELTLKDDVNHRNSTVVPQNLNADGDDDKDLVMKLQIQVEKGLMVDISILMANGERFPVVSPLVNQPYNENNLSSIISALKLVSTDHVKEAIRGL